jgi:hypothetical protein
MKVEIIERRRGKDKFWEIKMDGKTIEVTTFDPTNMVEEMCKEIKEKYKGDYSVESKNY